MATRYMFTPIIGDGTEENGYRTAVADVQLSGGKRPAYSSIIPTDQQGDPVYSYCFVMVAADNMPAVLQVTNSYAFPDVPLDVRMDAIGADPQDADDILGGLRQSVEARGLSTDFWLTSTRPWGEWLYREVLDGIVQQMEPVFRISNMWVQDLF